MNDARDHGNVAFATALYRRVAAGSGNLFLSPASVRIALGMALAGARGETARELMAALRLPATDERPDAAHAPLAAALRDWEAKNQWASMSTKPFVLRAVSRLWGSASLAFLPEFLSVLRDAYGAPLERVDFARDPEAARASINQSIEIATENKIQNLLPPRSVNDETRLVITSAIYFKATWASKFMKWVTKPRDFSSAPGRTWKAPTMEREAMFAYGEHDGARIVELPYASGDIAMVIVLPAERFGLAAIEERLNGGWLERAFASMETELVHLRLPRFRVESSFSLAQPLSALGILSAFRYGDADFSGMDGSREILIGDVLHKTFINVDEEGTEAAAATGIPMPGAAPPQKRDTPRQVFVDEPFFFVIRDTARGEVVFLGRVESPEAA